MKADEPENRLRLVKYGLPASEVPRFEARYAAVMEERRLFEAIELQHALQQGPGIATIVASLRSADIPIAEVAASVEPQGAARPSSPESETPRPRRAPDSLRTALGLK